MRVRARNNGCCEEVRQSADPERLTRSPLEPVTPCIYAAAARDTPVAVGGTDDAARSRSEQQRRPS